MSLLLYNLGLRLMELLAIIASPFNTKIKTFVKGRKQTFGLLEKQFTEVDAKILWVHASSIGEYEQSRPVIEKFKVHYPDFRVLVSFYSPSGYEAIQTDEVVNYKCYLPLDTRSNARKFIGLIQPDIVMFIKYEFWYYYLDELKKNNIPVFSVSSLFRPGQPFFKWYGKLFRKMLKNFNYFFVQDEPSHQLLKSIDIDSTITGDTRIDRVLAIRDEGVPYPIVESFIAEKPVFIIGSMRKEDIDFIRQFMRLTPDYKFIIAPHEITEEIMRPMEDDFNCVRYTNWTDQDKDSDILIIDTIGMLSRIYRYGQYAYVGGGFSDGLHNILEPAVYEIPVFFGNLEYTRFKEAMDLTGLGVAFAVGTAGEMSDILQSISTDKVRRQHIEEGIKAYLDLNKGASNRIIEYLNDFIK